MNKKTYKTNFIKCIQFNGIFRAVKNIKDLSVDSLISFMDLKEDIASIAKKYDDAMKAMFIAYGVTESTRKDVQDGQLVEVKYWDYENHAEHAEIKKKIEAINETEIEVSPVQFMTKDEFKGSTDGFTIEICAFVRPFLLKNE